MYYTVDHIAHVFEGVVDVINMYMYIPYSSKSTNPKNPLKKKSELISLPTPLLQTMLTFYFTYLCQGTTQFVLHVYTAKGGATA